MAFVCFGVGVMVGRYQVPPYGVIRDVTKAVRFLLGVRSLGTNGDNEVLRFGFRNAMIPTQRYPAVRTIEALSERLNGLLVPVAPLESIASGVRLGSSTRDSLGLHLEFGVRGKRLVADAYVEMARTTSPDCAALVVPGSGLDEGSRIVQRLPYDYHGPVLDWITPRCDAYVFVKPNEDYAAIHDGQRRLTNKFVVAYLLNGGGSYSLTYVTQLIALTKSLQASYARVALIGLSQGAHAALLAGIATAPTSVLVASGYSVLYDRVEYADLDQLMIPGLTRLYGADSLAAKMARQPTAFAFTFGTEDEGPIRFDARSELTCARFRAVANVRCLIAPIRHEFVRAEVERALGSGGSGVRAAPR